jgi:hypothetical protein
MAASFALNGRASKTQLLSEAARKAVQRFPVNRAYGALL